MMRYSVGVPFRRALMVALAAAALWLVGCSEGEPTPRGDAGNTDGGNLDTVSGPVGTLKGTVKDKAGNESDIAVTRILPFFGLTMKLGPIADWGINLTENLIPVDTESFATSHPGIFAIGDINS